jgi:asparagine synthase (glutamine-hydrolysing)
MFLSGGIDSSALLACMARLNERPVRAFTAGFPGTAVQDERDHARRVAKAAGAEHIEIAVTENDFWGNLPAIAAAMDDPVADYAIVPTFLLAREAAKELKVVLSGEGGDELFAGYGRYRRAVRSALLGGRQMYARGALDGLGVLRAETKDWRKGIEAAEQEPLGRNWSRLQAAQATDVAEWLPNDLLLKLDRCLMAHGVEGRTPFLDPVVADLAFRLPDDLKVRNRTGKYLLRRWLEQALPEADPFSKKRGFTVPVGDWIASHAGELAPLMAQNQGISEICRPDEVGRLFRGLGGGDTKRTGRACWRLLFYALWHRIRVEGAEPLGDTATVLAGK